MYRAQVEWRHILLIWVEDHAPSYAFVLIDICQRVVNAGAVQSGLADGIEQRVHCIKGQRGILLRLLFETGFKAAVEVEPARIVACGVIGKYRLESLGGWAGFSQQFRPQRAISTEDALLHAGCTHLLEDSCSLGFVGPQD